MNVLVQESADSEINRAIVADEQANAHYYQILKRFIPTKLASSDERLYQNDAKLDAGGLKLIDAAWLTQQYTEKKLRSAYMKVYAACI